MEVDSHDATAASMRPPVHAQRIALVTGGTDGIGKAIARVLAGQGIGLVIIGSNAKKGAIAVSELRKSSGHDEIEFIQADLSLMRNVGALALKVRERWPRLHYLVLCAGIMRGQHTLTAEGVETPGQMFILRQLGCESGRDSCFPALSRQRPQRTC